MILSPLEIIDSCSVVIIAVLISIIVHDALQCNTAYRLFRDILIQGIASTCNESFNLRSLLFFKAVIDMFLFHHS